MESRASEFQVLKNESKIMQFLNKVPGVPEMKWFCVDPRYNYMVMTLLGQSMTEIIHKVHVFPMHWIENVGLQGLDILERIHDKGFVHRDIKPDNFLFGLENKTQLYLIDFGLTKCYLDAHGKHQALTSIQNIVGSKNYASLHVHAMKEPSRRDDLESFVYVLLFLFFGNLDWDTERTDESMVHMKQHVTERLGIPEKFRTMLTSIRTLQFGERPNYDHLRMSLK